MSPTPRNSPSIPASKMQDESITIVEILIFLREKSRWLFIFAAVGALFGWAYSKTVGNQYLSEMELSVVRTQPSISDPLKVNYALSEMTSNPDLAAKFAKITLDELGLFRRQNALTDNYISTFNFGIGKESKPADTNDQIKLFSHYIITSLSGGIRNETGKSLWLYINYTNAGRYRIALKQQIPEVSKYLLAAISSALSQTIEAYNEQEISRHEREFADRQKAAQHRFTKITNELYSQVSEVQQRQQKISFGIQKARGLLDSLSKKDDLSKVIFNSFTAYPINLVIENKEDAYFVYDSVLIRALENDFAALSRSSALTPESTSRLSKEIGEIYSDKNDFEKNYLPVLKTLKAAEVYFTEDYKKAGSWLDTAEFALPGVRAANVEYLKAGVIAGYMDKEMLPSIMIILASSLAGVTVVILMLSIQRTYQSLNYAIKQTKFRNTHLEKEKEFSNTLKIEVL